MEVNGRFFPLWGQLVEHKEDWIDGKLTEIDDHIGKLETKITDIKLEPDGPVDVVFIVMGKDFSVSWNVEHLSISGKDISKRKPGEGLVIETPFAYRFILEKPKS